MTTHMKRETLEMLYNGELSLTEQMDALEHLSQCEYCAMQFANITQEQELLKAPVNMREAIMEKAGSLPVQLTVQTNLISKKVQLLTYGLKVSTAVICTLLLLGFVYTPDMTIEKPDVDISYHIKDKTNTWISNFNEFSTNLFHREDKQHD